MQHDLCSYSRKSQEHIPKVYIGVFREVVSGSGAGSIKITTHMGPT